ncbi:hypothetical protein BT96DRAFT_919129 [Gymnopus androsaceus JB14]|uniref:Uncharacterized protein n=1 Tax=Gymnopus androsaceus JB14 TaxID=1447944 RepID=A0A6A4HTE5_9AGAR|nr:hypothetical protein BT96DRAFT_919129 [Gymnopus androsaceus JB14]
MAEYLSQPRIEGPIWLESSDTQRLLERDSIRNILSPIRRAPAEILSEILELSCLPESGIFTASYDIIRHASVISRVCVAWRKAAYSTPRIWSKFCLSLRKHEMGMDRSKPGSSLGRLFGYI